jgi:hypothetical protein
MKCHLTYFSGWFANKTLRDLFFVIFKVGYFFVDDVEERSHVN